MPIYPKSMQEAADLINNGQTLVFHMAEWASKSELLMPTFIEMEKETKHLKFVVCDQDNHDVLVEITPEPDVPSFRLFIDGRKVAYLPDPSKIELEDFIREWDKRQVFPKAGGYIDENRPVG